MPHNNVVWHYVGVARTVWGYMTFPNSSLSIPLSCLLYIIIVDFVPFLSRGKINKEVS